MRTDARPFSYGLNAPTGAWCSLTSLVAIGVVVAFGLNAPTGAWCSLTIACALIVVADDSSQCTYRCVVLPDTFGLPSLGLAQASLNAPTGTWCSLTGQAAPLVVKACQSQCTYRCVVLPDGMAMNPYA